MSDVCLVLEGTYPYVTGGVSSWVHNLIRALPRVRFSLLTILPSRETYRDYKYEVPENVVSVSDTYIHDYAISDHRARRGSTRQIFDKLVRLYQDIPKRDYSLLPEIFRLVVDPATRGISPRELFLHKRTWEMVVAAYQEMELDESFVDFFWTWRYSHLPLLRLADARIPRASVYHTISTGYAGLLAGMAHLKTGAPVLLTEHGIYSNERRIEIEQARWIYERKVDTAVISATVSPFKKMWITLFDHLSRLTYLYSDEVITLFENNRRVQIAGGAEPSRTRVIPNGINLTNFSMRKQPKDPAKKFQIGFVGRVVSIKDVKTFIRACKIVHEQIPETYFPIMGPTEEEEEYFEECRSMVGMLGLEECVEFTGRVDVRQQYPRMDVVVLTSVSEAQPLVILEANICGVPCVATDVGACSELLYGRTPEDRALGSSGLITPIANPEATAAAIAEILSDDERRWQMGQSGIKRVEKFYNEQDLNFAYLDLYRRYIAIGETRQMQQEQEGAWRA
jgi:polysaccharide biosynthesis protein PelF